MRNLHGLTAAGLLVIGSMAAAGAATVRSASWRFERGENDGPALKFAAVAPTYDAGTALGFGAVTSDTAVEDRVSCKTGDSGFGPAPTGGAFHGFGKDAIPERVLQEVGDKGLGGGGAAHGVIVLTFEGRAPADVPVGPRIGGVFVPPIVAVACADAWLDSVEVSGELPRGGTGLQNTGYALRFEVPEPGAYGLAAAAVCAALALGRRRRGVPEAREGDERGAATRGGLVRF